MTKKEIAQLIAKELADLRKEEVRIALDNYLFNPSSLNYSDATIKMGAYQSASNVQRQIAEWDDE